MRATVIGSGPNGLAAAVALARSGYEVTVLEAAAIAGGGTSTAELTLPGFRHDIGSAVHPPAIASPFFRTAGIVDRVDWITPDISYAQALAPGRSAIAWRDLGRTAAGLGDDERAWRRMIGPLSKHIDGVVDFTGNNMLRVPRDPATAIRFALRMLPTGTRLGRAALRTPEAQALLTGVLAHANTPLPSLAGAAAGLMLAAHGHTRGGWGYPRGGAQAIADAMIADLEANGGRVETGVHVRDLSALDWGDPARGDLLMLDTTPRLALTLPDVPAGYARSLRRYAYGPAAAKVDFALDGPVPWADEALALAPTVHVGGSREETEASENAVAHGRLGATPYVLAVQPSVLDPTRAPGGKQTLWAYIHVPLGSPIDPTAFITERIEHFAPGFRDRVLASHAVAANAREAGNPAAIGGDILGGAFTLAQAFRRPTVGLAPWRTPMRGVYLAGASTPPGPGVTGMAGWHAARTALADRGMPSSLEHVFA
ncbi:phytoene desaturase family protein [Microbacterium halophytorum]|uniref:phytoene desaturase family protein n=1 Tax=Microbacterium halophytorum TaxID=2067568 RepID=UPI000CFAA4DA|nr:NAD(P)/FAD-dependent oxidoreductase [Microbacterium halophytorum]